MTFQLGDKDTSSPAALRATHADGEVQATADAGFTNRVMFGSDQMVWPGTIERAIAVIDEVPFLSRQQKRDIFYNNAAHFLRLSKEVIARHHLF